MEMARLYSKDFVGAPKHYGQAPVVLHATIWRPDHCNPGQFCPHNFVGQF